MAIIYEAGERGSGSDLLSRCDTLFFRPQTHPCRLLRLTGVYSYDLAVFLYPRKKSLQFYGCRKLTFDPAAALKPGRVLMVGAMAVTPALGGIVTPFPNVMDIVPTH
jgi:hypothetical protein